MGFWKNLFGTKQQDAPQVDPDKPPVQTGIIRIHKVPRAKSPVMVFAPRTGTNQFELPEYDLAEISRIEDVESYVSQSILIKTGLMFKQGWEFVGKNPNSIKYIKERFAQTDQATGYSHKLLFRDLASDLVRLSNAFVVKVRNTEASGGQERTLPGTSKRIKPVAGYFRMPASMVRIKRDKFGKILKYLQELPDGEKKEFSPEDVIHIFMHRKAGFMIGTPCLVPVKDDIRALRRIEENIEMLVYQHIFPLYHYKVGTEKMPAQVYGDGTREVDVVKEQLELMPAEGAIVTPERHEITAVGAQGRALQAEGYVLHFKKRVFAGLNMSAVDFGEGETANRATADNMSRNLVDHVKSIQQIFSLFINEYMIKELLLESTLDEPLDADNLVLLQFNEVDLDAKIKVENHAINAFGGYAITHAELRALYGREPFTDEDEEDSFWKRYEEPRLLIQSIDEPYSAEAQALARANTASIEGSDLEAEKTAADDEADKEAKRQAKVNASKAKARSGNGTVRRKPASSSGSRGQRAARGSDQPSNQHGKKSSPEKRKSSASFADMVGGHVSNLYSDITHDILQGIQTNRLSEGSLGGLLNAAAALMAERLLAGLMTQYHRAFRSAGGSVNAKDSAVVRNALETRVTSIVNRYMRRLESRIKMILKSAASIEDKVAKATLVLSALEFRSEFIDNSEPLRAHNYGIARALAARGLEEAEVVGEKSCEECQSHDKIILKHVTLDSVPGWHPNCTCKVRIPK